MAAGPIDNRLEVLRSTHLLDSPSEAAFDRLTRLASGLLHAPAALVSLVDEHRQFFKSAFGLGEPWASRRETPLSHSFCQHVTRNRAGLVVGDARDHPILHANLAVRDLHVIAYAGMPLVVDGEAIGALCVVDDKPRSWSDEELQLLRDLAESVVSEIELRIALRKANDQKALIDALIGSLGDGVLAVDKAGSFLITNGAARRMFDDEDARVGKRFSEGWARRHQSLRPDGTPMPSKEGALVRGLAGHDTDDLTFTLQGENQAEMLWIEASGRAVRDSDGKVIAAVATYRDVTERKREADRYSALAANVPGGVVALFDRDLRCLGIDGGMVRAAGIDRAKMIGQPMRALTLPENRSQIERVEAIFRATLKGEAVSDYFHRGSRTLSLNTAPVRDGHGRITAGVMLGIDVTTQRETETALRRSEQVYRAIVRHLPNGGVMMIDRDLRYVAADGPVVADILRLANVQDLVGQTVSDVSSAANREAMIALYRSVLTGMSRHVEVQRDGRFYDLSTVPIREGEEVTHALVFLYDVTSRKAEVAELKQARAELERRAAELREASVRDELTGLLNRRGFVLLGEQAMKLASRNEHRLVLLFIDLDGMKTINDELGHQMGDRALADTASLLRGVFRESDLIARLGGDEFVVLAIDAPPTSSATFVARLTRSLDEYNASDAPFHLSLSIGASVFDPASPLALDVLLSQADERMYEDKKRRRNSNVSRLKHS